LCPAEELLVERVLVSVYPASYEPARECAAKLAASALRKEFEIDWDEVLQVAARSEYSNVNEVKKLVYETAKAIGQRSPYHPDERAD
jgi:hypothetical protein